jgi:formate dehydrogenase alpha subunit
MPDEITITIDGQEVKTEPGKMVLEAAIDAGIYIPYLCYHPGMKPFGACRTCVVSVVDGRGTPASCTLPVQDGMIINNNVPEVNELRKSIIEMMIAEHPNGCLTCHRIDICGPGDVCLRHVSVNDRCITCPKNERCEFKDTVRYLGMELESHLDYKYKEIPLEIKDPFYDRDYNLCITCGRCVRVCEEIRGDSAITFVERGGRALVGTSFGSSLLESGCEFCGACLDVCPVGALVERENKWEKPREIKKTICTQCPVGCQMNFELNEFGRMIRVVPELDSPVNHGQACFRGKFGLDFVNSTSRIRHPMIRKDGKLTKVSWEEALKLISDKLNVCSKEDFTLLAAKDSTNEELYIWQKLVRMQMRTNNIDQSTNIHPELTDNLQKMIGMGSATGSIWDISKSECVLVFNANITEQQNVISLPIKKAIKSGAKLIVIDVREVELTRHSDVWIRPRPGSENMVLLGIMKLMLDNDLIDIPKLRDSIKNIDELCLYVQNLDLSQICSTTEVDESDLLSVAQLLTQSDTASIIYSLDTISRTISNDVVANLTNLTLITDNINTIGSGIYPMRYGANEQGAQDVGCMPNRLPGGSFVKDKTASETLKHKWGMEISSKPGIPVRDLGASVSNGSIKTMMIIGDLPVESDDSVRFLANQLQELDFLVVQDSFETQLTDIADVVLPRLTFAEKSGTLTNIERRVQKFSEVMPVKNNEAKSEIWVASELAKLWSLDGFNFANESAVMDEISEVCNIYEGISYEILDKNVKLVFRSGYDTPKPTQELYASYESNGMQWPAAGTANPYGSSQLFSPGIETDFCAYVPNVNANEVNDCNTADLLLVQGRVLFSSNNSMKIIEESDQNYIHRPDVFELNVSSAKKLFINEGDKITVTTSNQKMNGTVKINEKIPSGVLSTTSLFGELAIELQNSENINPMSDVPGLKVLAANIDKRK